MHLPATGVIRTDVGAGYAVGAGVGFVEQFHDLQVQLAHFERPAQQLIDRRLRLGQEVETGVNGGIDGGTFLADDGGVLGISGGPLEPVHHQLLQPDDRLGKIRSAARDGDQPPLPDQLFEISLGLPGGRTIQLLRGAARRSAGVLVELPGAVAHCRRILEVHLQPLGVEVHIRHRGEEGLDARIGPLPDPACQASRHDGHRSRCPSPHARAGPAEPPYGGPCRRRRFPRNRYRWSSVRTDSKTSAS